MKRCILLFLISVILVSCNAFPGASEKRIYFDEVPNEINTTAALKTFLSKNKNPKVVLRVNNSKYTITESENLESLYSIIERELMSNGFEVRDRLLFNQITENKDNTSNYENLYKKTDTDLILELMDMRPVPFTTNIYRDLRTGETKTGYGNATEFGGSIEFKVVIIKTNQFAGSYIFNTTPCTEYLNGCLYSPALLSSEEARRLEKIRKNQPVPPPSPELAIGIKKKNEDFVRYATQKLIAAMRSN